MKCSFFDGNGVIVSGNNCKLNNAMIKQLFVSIFYFSNTTLFNTIIESPQLYFNWNKGAFIWSVIFPTAQLHSALRNASQGCLKFGARE